MIPSRVQAASSSFARKARPRMLSTNQGLRENDSQKQQGKEPFLSSIICNTDYQPSRQEIKHQLRLVTGLTDYLFKRLVPCLFIDSKSLPVQVVAIFWFVLLLSIVKRNY